jgi:hypothetical protein
MMTAVMIVAVGAVYMIMRRYTPLLIAFASPPLATVFWPDS